MCKLSIIFRKYQSKKIYQELNLFDRTQQVSSLSQNDLSWCIKTNTWKHELIKNKRARLMLLIFQCKIRNNNLIVLLECID